MRVGIIFSVNVNFVVVNVVIIGGKYRVSQRRESPWLLVLRRPRVPLKRRRKAYITE